MLLHTSVSYTRDMISQGWLLWCQWIIFILLILGVIITLVITFVLQQFYASISVVKRNLLSYLSSCIVYTVSVINTLQESIKKGEGELSII